MGIMDKQLCVDKALRDNFDYVTATQLLFELISDINTYIKKIGGQIPNILLLNKSASFINDLLKIFGVISQKETYFLGAKQIESEKYLQGVLDVITLYRADLVLLFRNKSEWKEYAVVVGKYKERMNVIQSEEEEKKSDEISMRRNGLLQALVAFNENICKLTANLEVDSSKALIRMTDELRDVILPKYGVKIEDLEGSNGSIWKLYEADVLLKMLSATKNNQIEKDLDNWNKKALEPLEYFKTLKDNDGNFMYSQFDDKGMPTHDGQNKALSKSKLKKLPKAFKKQEKAYKQYQAKIKKNPTFLQDLEKELNDLKSQLL